MPRPKLSKGAASGSSPAKGKSSKALPKRAPKAEPKKKLTKRQAAKKKSEERSGKGEVTTVHAWLEKVQKMDKFKGVVQVGYADQLDAPYHLRRPTGVMSLDIALGGGFHAGGVAQIYSEESVGKTYLAFQTAGIVQQNYGKDANILIVPTEIHTDKSFARKAGLCIGYSENEIAHFENVRLAKGMAPYTDEERADLQKTIGNIIFDRAGTGDKALDLVEEALKSGLFQLVIIDSLGALLTPDQEAGDVGDRTYGGSSPILTNFMNKIYPLYMMARSDGSMLETTVIGINQARAEMNSFGHGPKIHAAAGAFAWKHAQLASIELGKSSAIKGSENGPAIGREIRWHITKGKAGTHDGPKGKYNYYHVPKTDPIFWKDVELCISQYGIDRITDMVDVASKLGVVEVAGSWYRLVEDGKEIFKAQGKEAFADRLVNEPDLYDKIYEQSLIKADLSVRYR